MSPEEFLLLAERLRAVDGEAERRSAVSRAYYALFHLAREMVESCGIICPNSASAHEKIPHCLENCGHDELQEAGRKTLTLRRLRNDADYSLDDPRFVDQRIASSYISHARVVFSSLLNLAIRTGEFRAGIVGYATQVFRFRLRS